MSARLVVPVALGLSLAAASALLLYYVLRREDEERADEAQVKTARQRVIEVPVPKNITPALIGRGGSNIKEMEKKAGCAIKLKKSESGETDVCLVRGPAHAAQLAETLIHQFISNQPLIEEDGISVPAWACGRIIGSGGENINDISHRSGARVKVEPGGAGDHTGQRLVSFRGTRAQIKLARDLVEKSVAQQKCLREMESSKSPRVGSAEPCEPGEANSIATHAKNSKRAGGAGGATIEVYVSAVSSPSRFWVQFVGAQVAQLDELVELMTDYYSNEANRELHKVSQVSVGQVVAAVFRHDGRWYRARVVQLRPNEYSAGQQVADVFFLDYGDSEYVATHELCELRADLLRLRFQAMECFLAGVRPAGREEEVVATTPDGQRWDKWNPKAIQLFEELTKVARWKSLVSATCAYKRCAGAEGERDKEIPGIKLYDITDQGEVDIGAVLVEQGWAVETPLTPRAESLPRDRDTPARSTEADKVHPQDSKPDDDPRRPQTPKMASHALSYADADRTKPHLNGSHDAFLNAERQSLSGKHRPDEAPTNLERHASPAANETHRPLHTADPMDELKANMNRMDSHHNLQAMGHEHGK